MATLYNIVLVLHVLVAIVAFGGMAVMSAYNSRAMAGTAGKAAALFETTVDVSKVSHITMYAVLPLGIVLVSLSDGAIKFSAIWISIAFVVWFAMVGVAHGLVFKNLKLVAARAGEMDASAPISEDTEAMGFLKQMGLGDAIGQVLLVIVLVLMVWQPGN